MLLVKIQNSLIFSFLFKIGRENPFCGVLDTKQPFYRSQKNSFRKSKYLHFLNS